MQTATTDRTTMKGERGATTAAAALTAAMWAALRGQPEVLSRVTFTGTGDMSCPFPVMDMAAAAFATAGAAVSSLLDVMGDREHTVSVDRRQAATWFDFPLAPTRFLDVPQQHGINGHLNSIRGDDHKAWMTEFETADGGWLRVNSSYPNLRARMVRALGLSEPASPADVQSVIGRLTAEDAEEQLVSAGAAAAIARSLEEWKQHPQGIALAGEPLVAITDTLAGPSGWAPTLGRPLLGIRVLDMTKVVAAPMATRFLAMLGAEVLRVDAPDSAEATLLGVHDLGLGKRWAMLDARTHDGRAQLRELLAGADVLLHGYHPRALDGLGLDADIRAQLRPGLVDVTLNAYGWTGPWRHRRGFDTLVQFSTGIAHEIARWASEDPDNRTPINAIGRLVDASRPRHLPVESLDFATGYQLAAAAIVGLQRRRETGMGSITRMSLARTAKLLVDHAGEPADTSFHLPDPEARLTDTVHGMGVRPTRRLAPPVDIDDVPLFWDRPAELPGSSLPQWAGPARDDR
ncbi:CoA transferase [Rhodococcus sp. IEGM 1307]|uniref:CoA transferase n=1 Tax=Rhodococcus sp. IEGM 1307 TaxID=3047091 RepID=UPI0024B7EAB1|nr:CoA transferase [Rhodococcus sp. IEGM 1307]MDI9979516.1 CoA transferase [Rhodococcus sp. IEGM 1307]